MRQMRFMSKLVVVVVTGLTKCDVIIGNDCAVMYSKFSNILSWLGLYEVRQRFIYFVVVCALEHLQRNEHCHG